MGRKIIFFQCLMFVIQVGEVYSQASGHPSHIDWKKISSPYFNIIYPKGKYNDAKRIGAFFTTMNENNEFKNQQSNRKIDLVLQTHQVVANGYVGIAPYRSEFYATPPQNSNVLSNANWLDLLSIHEYRHVQQASNAKVGITKVASILLGQAGWVGLKLFAMPNWFSEGDAVMAETMYSTSGRGRTPQFFARYKALTLDGKLPRYTVIRGGSYRMAYPNHYVYGYAMCNFVNQRFGQDTWNKIIDNSSRYTIPLYPFSSALDVYTGMRVRPLYKATNEALKLRFTAQLPPDTRNIDTRSVILEGVKTPTFYSFPLWDGDDIIFLKSSFKKTEEIIRLKPNGVQEKITNVGIAVEDYLSIGDGVLAWTEYAKHPRWDFENYSDIVLYDLSNNMKTNLTKKGKYFSPHVNRSLNQVVCVRIDDVHENFLVRMDMTTGKEIERIASPNKALLYFPKWINNTTIAYLNRLDGQAMIMTYNVEKKQHEVQFGPTLATISELNITKDKLVFTSSMDGSDQIYEIDLDTKEIMKVTQEVIGAYTPSLHSNGTLVYSTITSNGTNIVKNTKPVASEMSVSEEEFIKNLPYPTDTVMDMSKQVILKDYPEQNYNKMGRIQLHSYFINPDRVKPEANLVFENALGNILGTASLGYNINERKVQLGGDVSFSSGWPEIAIGFNTSGRQTILPISSRELAPVSYSEQKFRSTVSLPLSWIKGNFRQLVQPYFGVEHISVSNFTTTKNSITTPVQLPNNIENFIGINTGIRLTNLRRSGVQNYSIPLGQQLSVNYKRNLTGRTAATFNAIGALIFPGMMSNHRLKLSGSYYHENLANRYQYPDVFTNVRGNRGILNGEGQRFSIDYGLPVLYPEFGLLDIIYFKRIRLNFFGDASKVDAFNGSFAPKSLLPTNTLSYGAEVIFDNVFANFIPVSFGVRLYDVKTTSERLNSKYRGTEFFIGTEL